jgi:protein TonB
MRPVDDIRAALEYLTNARRGQVLIVDTRDATDVRQDVERAHAHAPNAVILVFATADAEKQVGAAVKGSNVFAVLSIPIDKRKTAAVLEGAISDAVAKRGSARTADHGVSVEPFSPQNDAAHAEAGAGSGGKKNAVVWGAVGFAVVAAAAGAFWFFSHDKPGTLPSTAATAKHKAALDVTPAEAPAGDDATLAPRPVIETSLVKGNVDELLEKARQAMRERRYTEPAGDNALLYYRSAAAADASNGEALDGMQRVASVLAARFDDAMNTAHFDEAALALGNLKSAAPKDARVASLELRLATAQINKSFADGNIERAAALVRLAQQSTAIPADQLNKWRSEIARRQEDAKLQRLAGLISDRIKDGRLLEPTEDSAKIYMQQLHDAAPTNTTTQRVARELNAAYMRKAREASLSKTPSDADRWLAEAKAGGVSAAELTNFQHDVGVARQKATAAEADRLAQLVRDRTREGKLTEPAQDSAAYYLSQLQATDAANAAIATTSHDLAGKLIDRARAQARDGNKAALVDADLTQAKHWGADPRDIQSVQQAQSVPRAAASAAPRSTANSNIDVAALAAQLKPTRHTPPEYPTKALDDRVNGAVTIEFVVDSTGATRDARIVEATPPGVFDKAAIAAVKRWRYEPLVVNGKPVEVPVRTSIRFALPK